MVGHIMMFMMVYLVSRIDIITMNLYKVLATKLN